MTTRLQLTREAKQTLLLLGVLAVIIAPHAGRLPGWCVVLTACILVWRGGLACIQGRLPRKPILLGMLALAFVLTGVSYGTFLTKDAGVTLAVLLVALKTLESRTWRDSFVVFLVGIFLVLTQFLYSQSLPLVLGMVLAVWGLLTLWVMSQAQGKPVGVAYAAALVGRMALWGAPFMVALFTLFPRIDPIWGVPQQAAPGTGLTERIRLGSISALAKDESIAMHVRFDQGVPAQKSLYFRGLVLGEFDGQQWRARNRYRPVDLSQAPQDAALRRETVAYQFSLEPQQLNFIPSLETTTELLPEGELELDLWRDWVWKTTEPLSHVQTFKARADLLRRRGPLRASAELSEDLRVPAGYNPRLHDYALAIRGDPKYANADAQSLVAMLMEHIRTQGYRYTLTPGTYGQDDAQGALDEFWFDRRAGFCEHFASAFAVILRELGVPARLVIGFQGAEYNPAGGYHVVRNSQAHAWVEYWQPEMGWTRVDPTTAILPEQIAAEASLRPPPGIMTASSVQAQTTLSRTLRHRWEALSYGWNQWVVNYSSDQQMSLLSQLGFTAPSMSVLVWLLCLAMLVILALFWLSHSRAVAVRHDLWMQTYRDMREKLQRAQPGAESIESSLPEHWPPRAVAKWVHNAWGPQGQAVVDILLKMEAMRYGPPTQESGQRAQSAQLKALTKRLQQALKQRDVRA